MDIREECLKLVKADSPPNAAHDNTRSRTGQFDNESSSASTKDFMPRGMQDEIIDVNNVNLQNDAAFAGQTDQIPLAPISKNQLKKLKRQQEWEYGRDKRKIKRKEKQQEKKQRKRARDELAASLGQADPDTEICQTENTIEESNTHDFRRHTQLPITFILDCDFDDLMLNQERISLASQITRCYSDNYKAPFKAHMAISSFGALLKERFDTVLSGHYHNWNGVRFLADDFVEATKQSKVWMKGQYGGRVAGALQTKCNEVKGTALSEPHAGEIVYLTSDSSDTLYELKPYGTYIIGGLVDRNRHKGICYKRAIDRGVRTAKLPIGDYMQMNSRFVLATNHVIEIMLRWLELGDWGEAFQRVVPKRKGGVLKMNDTSTTVGEDPDTIDGANEDESSVQNVNGGMVAAGDQGTTRPQISTEVLKKTNQPSNNTTLRTEQAPTIRMEPANVIES